MSGMQEGAASIAFMPSNPACVAFSCPRLHGRVIVYDFRVASAVQTIDLPQPVCSLAASPDASLLAIGGSGATVFLVDADAVAWRELRGHVQPVRAVAFANNGSSVVSAAGATLMQWSALER